MFVPRFDILIFDFHIFIPIWMIVHMDEGKGMEYFMLYDCLGHTCPSQVNFRCLPSVAHRGPAASRCPLYGHMGFLEIKCTSKFDTGLRRNISHCPFNSYNMRFGYILENIVQLLLLCIIIYYTHTQTHTYVCLSQCYRQVYCLANSILTRPKHSFYFGLSSYSPDLGWDPYRPHIIDDNVRNSAEWRECKNENTFMTVFKKRNIPFVYKFYSIISDYN